MFVMGMMMPPLHSLHSLVFLSRVCGDEVLFRESRRDAMQARDAKLPAKSISVLHDPRRTRPVVVIRPDMPIQSERCGFCGRPNENGE